MEWRAWQGLDGGEKEEKDEEERGGSFFLPPTCLLIRAARAFWKTTGASLIGGQDPQGQGAPASRIGGRRRFDGPWES